MSQLHLESIVRDLYEGVDEPLPEFTVAACEATGFNRAWLQGIMDIPAEFVLDAAESYDIEEVPDWAVDAMAPETQDQVVYSEGDGNSCAVIWDNGLFIIWWSLTKA